MYVTTTVKKTQTNKQTNPTKKAYRGPDIPSEATSMLKRIIAKPKYLQGSQTQPSTLMEAGQ